MSEKTRSRKTAPAAAASRRRKAAANVANTKRRKASDRVGDARRSRPDEAKASETKSAERSTTTPAEDEKPVPKVDAGKARVTDRQKRPTRKDQTRLAAASEEDETPAAMPQAAPLPPAAAIPGTEAFADTIPAAAQAVSAVPGLGMLAVPTNVAAAPEQMMREFAETARAGTMLNYEIMQSVARARSPADVFETQARAARTLSEIWMRQAMSLAGLFFTVLPPRR